MSQSAHHMQMYPSGNFVDLLHPDPDDMLVGDMAHHMSMICRFNGGMRKFYSVAEHSVLVGDLLESMGCEEQAVLAGYLHDAPEAFTSDLITPTKHAVAELETELGMTSSATTSVFARLTDRLDAAVARKFDISPSLFHSDEIKLADKWALFLEARALTGRDPARDWGLDGCDLPNDGHLPSSVPWDKGLLPSQARDAWLSRMNLWGAWDSSYDLWWLGSL